MSLAEIREIEIQYHMAKLAEMGVFPMIINKPNMSLAEIRETHHYVAKLAASDIDVKEISRVIGMEERSVEGLVREDPAFAELVAHYRKCFGTPFNAAEQQRLSSLIASIGDGEFKLWLSREDDFSEFGKPISPEERWGKPISPEERWGKPISPEERWGKPIGPELDPENETGG
jgi:hypothetical protein